MRDQWNALPQLFGFLSRLLREAVADGDPSPGTVFEWPRARSHREFAIVRPVIFKSKSVVFTQDSRNADNADKRRT